MRGCTAGPTAVTRGHTVSCYNFTKTRATPSPATGVDRSRLCILHSLVTRGHGVHQSTGTGGEFLQYRWYVAIAARTTSACRLAIDESSVILLQPPLPLVGVPIAMERERQQNDSLADG